jgi:signal transduction histidine kinase
MAHLLDDLGDLTRIESGRLHLSPGPLALAGAVEGALHAVRGLLAARRHTLEVDLDPGLPVVWADSVRLTQVLTNLLSNACKYTPEGGLVRVEATACGPALVEVTVRDTGLGIALNEQVRIFEPFFRSTDASIRLQPGTGLGLNITRHLVELQGGTIAFSSTPGEGTAFSFTLLVAPEHP